MTKIEITAKKVRSDEARTGEKFFFLISQLVTNVQRIAIAMNA